MRLFSWSWVVSLLSHSPGSTASWKLQVEGNAAAHSWDVSGEVPET